jgi:hypothetical protein
MGRQRRNGIQGDFALAKRDQKILRAKAEASLPGERYCIGRQVGAVRLQQMRLRVVGPFCGVTLVEGSL